VKTGDFLTANVLWPTALPVEREELLTDVHGQWIVGEPAKLVHRLGLVLAKSIERVARIIAARWC